jgi:hypothetical protein
MIMTDSPGLGCHVSLCRSVFVFQSIRKPDRPSLFAMEVSDLLLRLACVRALHRLEILH